MTWVRFSVVAALDEKSGIGKNQSLPWHIPEDLRFFKTLTTAHPENTKNVLIMGYNTWQSLACLPHDSPDRVFIVLTKNWESQTLSSPNICFLPSLEQALEWTTEPCRVADIHRVFVIGGEGVFKEAVQRLDCTHLYLTEVGGDFECDRFFPAQIPDRLQLQSVSDWKQYPNSISYRFIHLSVPDDDLTPSPMSEEAQYLQLVHDAIERGQKREDRTGVGTRALFGCSMKFNLRDHSFPLLTTKYVAFDLVLKELLWFISGKTDAKVLHKQGVKIWDANGSREALDKLGFPDRETGDLGPVYGFQWRHFGAEYKTCHDDYTGKGVDQLKKLIDTIKTDPCNRRLILSAWNPAMLSQMALPPCHMFCQFFVDIETHELSCTMYQRSADLGLGVPFNMASYSLLTCMVARVCGLKPGELWMVLGDTHVYENHIQPLQEQCRRRPRPFPKLFLDDQVQSIDDFETRHFRVVDYNPWPKLAMKMAV